MESSLAVKWRRDKETKKGGTKGRGYHSIYVQAEMMLAWTRKIEVGMDTDRFFF